MYTQSLQWTIGWSRSDTEAPEERFPAQVPGAAQLDYACHHNLPPY